MKIALRWAEQLTQEHASRLTQQAFQALEEAQPQGEAGDKLRELADQLL